MDSETQLYIFVMLAVGTVAAVLLTLLVVKALGLAKAGDPLVNRRETVQRFGRSLPGFSELPDADQERIATRAMRHPLVFAYPVAILAGFIWTAIGNLALLDAINSHWRIAALIGIAVLAVIIFGMKWLQGLIARRMVARVRAERLGR